MNHSFTPSQTDSSKCGRCKFDEVSHTSDAECTSCGKHTEVEVYIDMLFCAECMEKERLAQIELESTANARVAQLEEDNRNKVIIQSQQIDASIEVRRDLFNANTVAITEIKNAIDSDDSIPSESKHYELAKLLHERLDHFSQVLFTLNESRIDITNKQYAVQVYLNDLASKLRKEEREKLRLQYIDYKPPTPSLKKLSAPKKVKFDKNELRKCAAELGISEFMLQTVVVSKNMSVSEAASMIRKNIEDAKSSNEAK